ncbi:acyl-CoA thioesterase [Granulosicoccaceae sp. 1_MG-2023]|nr:acyl-CoA thioesterase [Granulosicoccaceae sp. 1_MG-2023]
MYPVSRLISTLIRARFSAPLSADQTSEIRFRVRPWDLDMFMEMNNGRVLTLFDLGRFDLSVRNGLMRLLRKHRWGLVVAGSTVLYRKRIRLFDPVSLQTRLAGLDERWVYIEQTMSVRGTPANSVLLRTAVTEGGRILPTERLIAELGYQDRPLPQLNHWQQAWIDSERLRPWPPQQD